MKRLAASLLLLVSLSFSIVASSPKSAVIFDFTKSDRYTTLFPQTNVSQVQSYTMKGSSLGTCSSNLVKYKYLKINSNGYLSISRPGAKITKVTIFTYSEVSIKITTNNLSKNYKGTKEGSNNYKLTYTVPINELCEDNEVKLDYVDSAIQIIKLVIEYEVILPDYRIHHEQTTFENQPVLSCPEGVTVTYTTSDPGIVTVDEHSGAITAVNALGVATISAEFEGSSSYQPSDVSYDVEVYKNNDEYVLSFNNTIESFTTNTPFTMSDSYWAANNFTGTQGQGYITCDFSNGNNKPLIWLKGSSSSPISHPISEVEVYVDVTDSQNYNGVTLERSEKSDGSFDAKDSFSGVANANNSVIHFTIPEPQENLTYRVTFSRTGTTNGSVKVKKVVCKSVGHIRTGLTGGRWASVCLPYNVKEVTGADVYMISHKTVVNNVVTSIEVAKIDADERLVAGTPYFIRANGDGDVVLKYDYEAPMATAPGTDGHGHYGVFEDTKIGDIDKFNNGVYMLSNNELKRATANSTCKANRAYIVLDEVHDNSPIPEAMGRQTESIGAEKGTTTAISEILVDGVTDQVIYDLQGRRVVNPTNGIYVINGKKVNLQK